MLSANTFGISAMAMDESSEAVFPGCAAVGLTRYVMICAPGLQYLVQPSTCNLVSRTVKHE